MEKRKDLIATLLDHFLADLDRSAKPLTTNDDKIYFLETLSEYLSGVYNSVPENEYFETIPFNEDQFIRENLLSRFRDKMSGFISTNLRYYFSKEDPEKTFLFNKLQIKEPVLTSEEYEDYILRINFLLSKLAEQFYLKPKEGSQADTATTKELIDQSEEGIASDSIKSRSKEHSRSRQVLLYYFMLRSMGVSRTDISVSNQARFAHVLFNLPIDNIDNSAIYKKLKAAPFVNKIDRDLLKDLEFVKQQFELIEHEQGIALVEAEIKSTKENMKKNR